MPRKSIDEIRQYTTRKEKQFLKWLPSTNGEKDFNNTFTLKGENADGSDSTGEINVFTQFDSKDNSTQLEPNNLNRFFLALYCMQNQPYYFSEINKTIDYTLDDKLFTQQLESFLQKYQTANGENPQTRSLTADIVRFYRGDKIKDIVDTEEEVQTLIKYAQKSKDYKDNVVGVLGKITYDSIVKHTLYSLLVRNNILKKEFEKGNKIWSEEASKLESGQFNFFVDIGGGTYSRAFPVLCVFTKNKSGKKIGDLLTDSNSFVESKFFRKLNGEEQLVKSQGNRIKDKNFIELPVRESGDSVYCILYDFVNVLVLDPISEADYTLDILKISLSFFSRKNLMFSTVSEFKLFFESLQKFIQSSFGEDLEKLDFKISLKNKHSKEVSYTLDKQEESISVKLNQTFKADIVALTATIGTVYTKIIDLFNQETSSENKNFQFNNYPKNLEYPIILHFDNFYNLLAVTSVNISPQETTKEYETNIPFDVKEYEFEYKYGDLIKEFYKDPLNLTKIPAQSSTPDYQYTPSIATEQDIVLITDAFLRQVYEGLKKDKNNLVYENDSNQLNNDVLQTSNANITNDIKIQTKKDINVDDYFVISSNKIYLKKEVVKKLNLNDLYFIFDGTKEDKIKFQTICHFLFLNLNELKKTKPTIDDFKTRIYYPILDETISPVKKTEDNKKEEPPKKPSNNNFLINNIITSELSCYGDIANSFDKAVNAEKTEDKIYYAFQALVNIGLPILLALSAQAVANKISELKKKGTTLDPDLLECVLSDTDKLKKTIIGYTDIFSNINNPADLLAFVSQNYLELPAIPAIPFFLTFDAEKELKRRIFKAVVDFLIKLLSEQLQAAIRSIIDMCNSDSYLTAFLNSALPSDNSANKIGTSTSSGLPAGTSSTTYIPTLLADINVLIDQSNIQTREVVYENFKRKYLLDIPSGEISDFFDLLSSAVDAGEMASLLKGSSTFETRSTVISYIQNYENKKFFIFINDAASVADLFEFLSEYIDFRLCYGVLSDSLSNYSSNVCEDIDSRYDENVLKFGEETIKDQLEDLTKSLDEICRSKNPQAFDLLSNGPSFLTKKMTKVLNDGFKATVTEILNVDNKNVDSKNLETVNFPSFDEIFTIDSKNFSINPQDQINFEELKKNFYRPSQYVENFDNKLKSSGNVGLKTTTVSIDGYVRKLKSFQKRLNESKNKEGYLIIDNKIQI